MGENVPASAESSSWLWFLSGGALGQRKERVSSKKHKQHREYSWSDIAALDAQLAHEIHVLSRVLGYSHSQRRANLSRSRSRSQSQSHTVEVTMMHANIPLLSPPWECD